MINRDYNKKYKYRKPYWKCNSIEKIIRLRYYLIVPIDVIIYFVKYMFGKKNMPFKQYVRFSVREARWWMGKRNTK